MSIAHAFCWTLLAAWPAMTDTGFLDRSVLRGGIAYRYQVYVPAEFDPARSWPVVVFLHGNDARGTDGLLPTARALGDVIRRHRALYPAVVVFPQAQPGTRWVDPDMQDLAMAALDRTLEEFHGDPDRVSLVGHSAGAAGVYRIAYRYPQRFAALLATAGPVESNLTGAWSAREIETDRRAHGFTAAPDPFAALARSIRHVPIRLFHGDADRTVSVEQSRRLFAALKKAGADVGYTEFAGEEHRGTAERALENPDTVAWLLAQRRRERAVPQRRSAAGQSRITEIGDGTGSSIALTRNRWPSAAGT
jgi:predicted peptidase